MLVGKIKATLKKSARFRAVAIGCAVATGFGCSLAGQSTVGGFAVIGTIPAPDGAWDYASIDAAARRLYIAHGDSVLAVDLDSGNVNPKLVAGKRLHTVVPLPNGKALVTDSGTNSATVFEAATGTVVANIRTGNKPDSAVFDRSTGLVLVMDAQDGDITLIDLKTSTSPGRIPVGGELEFAATDGRGHVYVNVYDKNQVAVIDVAARKVLMRYALPGCHGPSGLALDPSSGLLVASCENERAVALHSQDGRLAARLAIGKGPDQVIFDAARKLFFIPCESGTLTVVAERGRAAPVVSAVIPTAVGARTGALDAKTGRLYLPAAELGTGPPDEHPPSMPGTFRILIVGTH